MKTNSLQRSSRSRGRGGLYAAIGVIVLAIVISGLAFSGAAGGAFQFALSPLWRAGAIVENSLSDLFSVFFSKQAVFDQNRMLLSSNAALQAQMADYQALKAENADLSAALGRKPKEASFAAAVILRPPELPYDTFLLDLGSADGIEAGDIVLGDGGTYLGTISETSDHSSKALLASTPGIETKAILDGLPIILTGKGGGAYEAPVPQTVAVAEGDPATLSPGDFVLGSVAGITVNTNNAYREVTVRTDTNISEAGYVFIAKQKSQ